MNMRDVNVLSKIWYILENLAWSFLALRIYRINSFTNIVDCDYETSKKILYIMTFGLVLVGIAITIKHRRNSISTAINVLLPLVLYTFATYFQELGVFILIAFLIGITGSIVYILMTLKYSKSKARLKNRGFNKIRFCALGARTIITSCCSIVVIYIAGTAITGIQLYRPSTEASDTSSGFIEYLDENSDAFDLLEESKWQTLTNNQKLDVLQMVCNGERIRLGIQSSIRIKSRYFENNLLGSYVKADQTIIINTKLLKEGTAEEVMACTTHECFHSLQYDLVALYDSVPDEKKKLMIFNTVEKYKTEFSNYKDGYCADFNDYYGQSVEEDARSYENYAPDVYLERAEKHEN